MKRHPALVELSREHHQSLRLARDCLRTAQAGDPEACRRLAHSVAADYPDTWAVHFATEEQTIFPLAHRLDAETQALVEQLIAEHRRMDHLAERLAEEGGCQTLSEFGALLRDHTRTEERLLFPRLQESGIFDRADIS